MHTPSSYENAPATRLLASHCACCNRPLVDAKSVELGIGPDCRAKYGFDLAVPDAARVEANRIVYAIALANVRDPAARIMVQASIATLRTLGFAKLADRVAKRLPKRDEPKPVVTIEVDGGAYVVRAPYDARHVDRMRLVPGRRWDRGAKADRVPVASKGALFAALRASFAGAVALGPKGLFVLA